MASRALVLRLGDSACFDVEFGKVSVPSAAARYPSSSLRFNSLRKRVESVVLLGNCDPLVCTIPLVCSATTDLNRKIGLLFLRMSKAFLTFFFSRLSILKIKTHWNLVPRQCTEIFSLRSTPSAVLFSQVIFFDSNFTTMLVHKSSYLR